VSERVRGARQDDVAAMVELSERQRQIDEARFGLRFYRKAADSHEKRTSFFASLLTREQVIVLVHERDGAIDGFAIGMVVDAPPVYDPGGLTCLVDDFVVLPAEEWATTGPAIPQEVNRLARERGAVQTVVVCRRLDEAKRAALTGQGLTLVSEWYVGEL
jgi:DNA-binding transcriptional LysR family regulator